MYEKQIEAGMAFMDEHDVPEWKSLINLDTLKVAIKTDCVLGQRFEARAVEDGHWNGFEWAQKHFALPEKDMIRLGFDIPQIGSYGLLTTEWIAALKPFQKVAA